MSKYTTSIKALYNDLTVYCQTELIREVTGVNVSDGLRILMTANDIYKAIKHKVLIQYYYRGRDYVNSLDLNIVSPEIYPKIDEEKLEELSKFSQDEIKNMATAMKNKARNAQFSA